MRFYRNISIQRDLIESSVMMKSEIQGMHNQTGKQNSLESERFDVWADLSKIILMVSVILINC